MTTTSLTTRPGTWWNPGAHDDVAEADYFGHPALSHSGAKLLLESPALFKWRQDHPQPAKKAFDYGHAAHALVLGTGAEIVEVKEETWAKNVAKAARDQAYAEGKVPLLYHQVQQVKDMAAALLQHPVARKMFTAGKAEQSLFWADTATGVHLRCRIDWLPYTGLEQMVIPDYKTTVSATGPAFQKALLSYGYHQQADWYSEAVRQCGIDEDPRFVFVCQEKTAPYLVQIFEPDAAAIQAGREANRRAINLYAQCEATDTWPGYSEAIELVSLPPWAAVQADDAPIDDVDDVFGRAV